ncbi:hypothetical protein DH2020_038186 [Rehmannia glutinosa]|uniref:Protein kinase domain-containing protein n=1 Tax=Rehmannia glutinosa TaxID=99300 RepID=A0ABR0V0I9_REHGL
MAIIHVLGSSIYFYIFLLIFPITNSISDSEALLKLKESFTNSTALDSWKLGTEPCTDHWIGVRCDNGVVWGLRLGHLGLSGKIDVDALGSLSGLRSISVMSNAFSGPIPDFRRLGILRGLYLSMNQFSGEIPSDYFTSMGGLRKVWLSGNGLSGPIPSSLAHLTHLMELHLENNQFSGAIPPFDQPSLVSFNLSNNNLEGEIPSGMSRFSQNAFTGNPGLCGGNLGKACDRPAKPPAGPPKMDGAQMKIIMWALLASLVVLFSLMIVGIFVLKRRQESLDPLVGDDVSRSFSTTSFDKKNLGSGQAGFGSGHRTASSGKGSRKYGKGVGDIVMINDDKGEFGLADLMKAAAEVLGNGALGSSYKAMMANGLTVVVKRIKESAKMGKDQFDGEMTRIGSLKHNNVLTPLAYHYRKDEKLLVYEYQPKGSLQYLLHGDRGISHAQLNWPTRLKIIQGIARGLAYLHTQLSSLDLPHGNLKSSNILLTPDYDPLLVDYGFSSFISSTQASQALIAYKSPEATLDHDISPKCDVYCLGLVILEILTGKFPCQYLNNGEGGTDIVQWVRSAIVEGKEVDMFDPDIECNKSFIGEMEQILHIGAACTENSPDKRLDVTEAVRRIEGLVSSQDDTKTIQVLSGDAYGDRLGQ